MLGLEAFMFDTCLLSFFNLNNIDIVGIDTDGFIFDTCPPSLLCSGIVPLAQHHPGGTNIETQEMNIETQQKTTLVGKIMFSFKDVQWTFHFEHCSCRLDFLGQQRYDEQWSMRIITSRANCNCFWSQCSNYHQWIHHLITYLGVNIETRQTNIETQQ